MPSPYKISKPFTTGDYHENAIISCSIEGKRDRIITLAFHKAVKRDAFNVVLIEYREDDVNKSTTHHTLMIPVAQRVDNPPIPAILKFANDSLENIVNNLNEKMKEQ